MLSALYMISPVRLSLVDQDSIMKLLPYGSPIPLVFAGQVSPRNSNWASKGRLGKKGSRYCQSYY